MDKKNNWTSKLTTTLFEKLRSRNPRNTYFLHLLINEEDGEKVIGEIENILTENNGRLLIYDPTLNRVKIFCDLSTLKFIANLEGVLSVFSHQNITNLAHFPAPSA